LDGDARGGAALSIRYVTKVPIKFVGVGERVEELEAFYPERISSRIIGMGDLLTFIEKAGQAFEQKEAIKLQKKIKKNELTLDDFKDQLMKIKKMGSLNSIMEMIPGFGAMKDVDVDDREIDHVVAIINSMTFLEREKPKIINGSRKKRIAKGSGRNIQEINRLLKQFSQMRKMMKQFRDMKGMKGLKGLGLPFFGK
jgi:signal recognition particle subunit SRP54